MSYCVSKSKEINAVKGELTMGDDNETIIVLCGPGYAKDMNAVLSFGEVSEVKGYDLNFSTY